MITEVGVGHNSELDTRNEERELTEGVTRDVERMGDRVNDVMISVWDSGVTTV